MKNISELDDQSRVWVYQADRILSTSENEEIQTHLNEFTRQWTSHNNALVAKGLILNGRHIVLMVDETSAGASGCSIDKSVAFVKWLGQKYNTDFFNRHLFAYQEDGEVKIISQNELGDAYSNGIITDHTLMYDNLINTKKAFDDRWLVPLKDSWFRRLI